MGSINFVRSLLNDICFSLTAIDKTVTHEVITAIEEPDCQSEIKATISLQ